jgi:hypothetical protein
MVAGDYPTLQMMDSGWGEGVPYVYEVGYILGEYIIEKWGKPALRELIIHNGDLEIVIGLSVTELEMGWHKWIKDRYFFDEPLCIPTYLSYCK